MAKKETNIVVRLRDQATAGFTRLGRGVRSLLTPLGLVTTAFGTLASLTGGVFLLGAIRNTASFGEQMSILRGLTQGTTEQMDALEQKARAAGASTRFSATEAAQGLEELARGGQNAEEAISSLDGVLALAAGNNQTVAESAQQVITTLNQFNLAAEDSGRVADVYTRSAQRSAQTTQQLARAFQQAGPVAAQANLTIEQTSAIIDRLADAGFRGERGGTALRNTLSQLSDPASKFRRELGNLGITSTDFIEVLGQLEARGEDANVALRALGLESAPAIIGLVNSGTTGLRELVGELERAGGAADDAARAMENNLPGAIRNLQSAYSELQIQLAQPLTERITEEVFKLADAIRTFSQSSDAQNLRQILVDGFDQARDAVVGFLQAFDLQKARRQFSETLERGREFFNGLVEAGETSARVARITGAAWGVLAGELSQAWNLTGQVISRVSLLGVRALEGLLTITRRMTFGIAGLSKEFRDLEEAVQGQVETLQESFFEYRDATVKASEDTEAALERLAQAWVGVEEPAQAASDAAASIDEGLGEAVDRTDSHLDRLKASLFSAGLSAEQLGLNAREGVEEVDSAVGSLERKAERTRDAIGQINGEWVSLEGGASDAADSISDLRKQAEEAATPFERLEQAIQGASDGSQLDQLVVQMRQLQAAGELTEEQVNSLTDSLLRQAESLDRVADSNREAQRSGSDAAQSVREVGEAVEETGRRAGGAATAIAGVLDSWRVISESSAAAVNAFVERMGMGVRSVQGYFFQLARFTDTLAEQQRQQIEAADAIIEANEGAAAATQLLNAELVLLDKQRIEGLERVIEANRRAREEEARRIGDLVSGNRALIDELDLLNGKQEEVAERRLQRLIEDLQIQLRDARAAGNREEIAALEERIRLEKQLAEAKKKADEEGAATSPSGSGSSASSSGSSLDTGSPSTRSGGVTRTVDTIRIEFQGGAFDLPADQRGAFDRFLETIGRSRGNTPPSVSP